MHSAESNMNPFTSTLMIEKHKSVSQLLGRHMFQPMLVLVLCTKPLDLVMKIIKLVSPTV